MRTSILGALAAAGALGAAALLHAAPAHADDLGLLSELNSYGFAVNDTSRAILTGHQICNAMAGGLSAEQVAHNIYVNTTFSDIPTLTDARAWVVAAGDQVCPWEGVSW